LYSPYLYNICRKFLDDVEDCHDLVLQAFCKIFQNIEKAEFSNEFAFKSWMKKIQINETLHLLKKMRSRIKLEEIHLDAGITIPTSESDLECADLFSLMNLLPEGYRRIFYLHQIEGYTHKEIAAMLHIEEGTSKSQCCKAKHFLKEIINRQNNNLHENS
jgi:RNA polymerase sigma-70 factor (ECF subfamily)